VIGVAADTRSRSLWEPPSPLVYLPFERYVRRQMTLLLRTAGDPAALAPEVRSTLRRRYPDFAIVDLMTFRALLSLALGLQRMNAQVVALFGALGLALAALGVGSAMSASVAQRGHEIGVRMALGAGRRGMLWLVLRRALGLAALGAALGTAATLASSRLLATFIEGMETRPEPAILAAAALLLLAVCTLASYRPARRAASVDPASVLKGG
jgi:putative ABC transport system permease protein